MYIPKKMYLKKGRKHIYKNICLVYQSTEISEKKARQLNKKIHMQYVKRFEAVFCTREMCNYIVNLRFTLDL